jgi:hypothetical protein
MAIPRTRDSCHISTFNVPRNRASCIPCVLPLKDGWVRMTAACSCMNSTSPEWLGAVPNAQEQVALATHRCLDVGRSDPL